MTGEQGTLDSSLGGHYMNKASNYGPAVFKTAELVRKQEIKFIKRTPQDSPLTLIKALRLNPLCHE